MTFHFQPRKNYIPANNEQYNPHSPNKAELQFGVDPITT